MHGFRTGVRAVNKQGGRLAGASSLPATIKDMLPLELAKLLKSENREQYQIVDVREADELQLVSLPDKNVIHLPLSTASTWTTEIIDGKILDNTKPTICLCHHGVRSFRMASFLTSQAEFIDVYNVKGGIHAYAEEADPSIGTY
eukprot:gene28895-34869_t